MSPVGLVIKPYPHGTGAVNSDPALVSCGVGPQNDQLRGARRTFKTYGQVVNVSLPSSEPRRVCSIPNIPTLWFFLAFALVRFFRVFVFLRVFGLDGLLLA